MVYVARAALHFWEEPCISGENGSGTVFFSGCPLRCVYCQNFELARAKRGKPVTVEALSRLFLKLQEEGANNINLVTPTQYTLAIIPAVRLAKDEGLHLPIVYNCGGYESVETLRLLEGTVDIYLTDLKYLDEYASKRYSGAADYPAVAKDAIYEMVRQCKETVFECGGMMQKGVIVRHLLLPGRVREAKQVVRYLYSTYGNAIWMSLLNQYTPFGRVKERFPELARGVTKREYDTLVDYAIELGVTNAFIQEGATAKESFIPGFSGEGVRS
jgi:putative pyruvate formate lyase activating enzyme